jgi:hypothetical protein
LDRFIRAAVNGGPGVGLHTGRLSTYAEDGRSERVLSHPETERWERGARAITIQINGATLSLDEIADTVLRKLQVYELAHAVR